MYNIDKYWRLSTDNQVLNFGQQIATNHSDEFISKSQLFTRLKLPVSFVGGCSIALRPKTVNRRFNSSPFIFLEHSSTQKSPFLCCFFGLHGVVSHQI